MDKRVPSWLGMPVSLATGNRPKMGGPASREIDRLASIFLGLVTRIHEAIYSRQPFYLSYTCLNPFAPFAPFPV